MIEQKPKKWQRTLWVVKAEVPDVEWLVRVFDTYEEALAYKSAIVVLNSKIFNHESPLFGTANKFDPDMQVDDGEPDYFVMEVPYAS